MVIKSNKERPIMMIKRMSVQINIINHSTKTCFNNNINLKNKTRIKTITYSKMKIYRLNKRNESTQTVKHKNGDLNKFIKNIDSEF